MSKLRIVVSGSKGFVGSVFALRAIERGHDVLALDNESRGLNPIEEKIGTAYQKFDCMQGFKEAALARGWDRVDAVAHFAAATGSLERPLDELREFNVDMMLRMYEDARALDARAFLWPTTSLALGVPDSPYVMSKEEGLAKLKEVDGAYLPLNAISIPVRFFNVAGAYKGLTERRKNEVHILPVMLEAYRNRSGFTINGDDYATADGTPSRDLVHIVDVVEYLLDIAEKKVDGWPVEQLRHPKDDAIWLGTGRSITVKQMIAAFSQWVGELPDVRIGPRRSFDCGSLHCDEDMVDQFTIWRNGLMPTWASIRDELIALTENPVASQAIEPVVSVEEAKVTVSRITSPSE